MLITWIEVKDGDSGGMKETDETSQRTRRGGDGSSLPPRNASICNGNQSDYSLLKASQTLCSPVIFIYAYSSKNCLTSRSNRLEDSLFNVIKSDSASPESLFLCSDEVIHLDKQHHMSI